MSIGTLKSNLAAFKRKFYINKLLKGTLLSSAYFLLIFLIFSVLEGFFWFSQPVRLVLFILAAIVLFYFLIFWIAIPIATLLNLGKGLSDKEAAILIGQHFKEVDDKLLNYLQLSELDDKESSLISAAVAQKTSELYVVPFSKAISFSVNKQYAAYLAIILVCITLVSFISPGLLDSGSSRIISFNKEFVKPAPFDFIIQSDLKAYKNDAFQLEVALEGNSLPEEVYLLDGDRKLRMNQSGSGFQFSFPSLQANKTFRLTAAGFESKSYEIEVFSRPIINELEIEISYPGYTQLKSQKISNTGSLIVPEGSKLKWSLDADYTEEVSFVSEEKYLFENTDNQRFIFEKTINKSLEYQLILANDNATNKSPIKYEISVIKDESPLIEASFIPDTLSYSSLLVSGNISDDYGFKSLALFYRKSQQDPLKRIPISLQRGQNHQQFYLQWSLDSLNLQESQNLEVFAQVWDNDQINGYKSSSTPRYFMKFPSEEEIDEMLEEKSKQSENQLEDAAKKADMLNEKIEELEDRLKNKNQVEWQEEKLINEILKDKEQLEKELNELKKEHENFLKAQKEFDKQSKSLQEKSKKLQDLLNEVLDEETKKLYDELQKLLKEQSNTDEVMDQLSKLKNKESNLEKELDRALELFKRLKMETQLEQTTKDLEQLSEDQKKLSEESKSSPNDELKSKQEEINKKFEEIKKEIDEVEEMNQDLKKPEPLEDFSKDEKEIDEKLNEIPEDLDQDKKNKAAQKMKNAGEKMQQLAQKMGKMQEGMEMIMMEENLDDLRDILDNLIKLSFDQERIIEEIKGVQQVDPRFIELSQDQLQLTNNAKIVEDSLLSLASRVVQISTFITREINEININLESSIHELRERNKGKANSHQQYAMTSMNNLALLLDDVLSQMQMSMSEAMGKPKKNGNKKSSLPSMSEMQKQLSEQIQDLKKSGKSGRELSEELAKLAAEQAELREKLQEMQQSLSGQPNPDGEESGGEKAGSDLKKAIEKMEENEVDLVNKRLTDQLIQRQEEILTRMLEAEKSMREQKQSPEREGETANQNIQKLPPEIEEYLKAKKSEVELLKTIPLELIPFYKKEVNDYFRRLSTQDQ